MLLPDSLGVKNGIYSKKFSLWLNIFELGRKSGVEKNIYFRPKNVNSNCAHVEMPKINSQIIYLSLKRSANPYSARI